ncbi:MAG TPA: hypothetical protein VI006_11580 [Solirubrobacteraceae bacterium]
MHGRQLDGLWFAGGHRVDLLFNAALRDAGGTVAPGPYCSVR